MPINTQCPVERMIMMMTIRMAAFIGLVTLLHSGQAFQTRVNPASYVMVTSSARVRLLDVTSLIPSAWATTKSPRTTTNPVFSSSLADADEGVNSSLAEAILDEFHRSSLPFRIVVIGNGAILETTSRLGPTSKAAISPKSGERLLTFASEDQSFEFHVKVEQVGKVCS